MVLGIFLSNSRGVDLISYKLKDNGKSNKSNICLPANNPLDAGLVLGINDNRTFPFGIYQPIPRSTAYCDYPK
jgi:hypothetical protein